MDPALLEEFCAEYTAHLNRLRGAKNASLAAARRSSASWKEQGAAHPGDQGRCAGVRGQERPRPDRRAPGRARSDLEGTTEEPVLLHPKMAAHYRAQVARLAEALNADENRAEAADLLRSLIERIELTPKKADSRSTCTATSPES